MATTPAPVAAPAGPTGPLSLELLLLQRLRQALAGNTPAVHVLAAADLAGVAEERQLVPAVQVVYGGIKPLRTDVGDTLVEATWHTVVAVRNASTTGQGAAGRSDANSLTHAVYSDLVGWTPPGHCQPLTLVSGPGGGHNNGFFYLPLTWRTAYVWRSDIATTTNPFFP